MADESSVDAAASVVVEPDLVPGLRAPTFLADTLPQIVWTADAAGDVTYFNRSWYEYTGLSPMQSVGSGFLQVLHPSDVERTAARWERAWRDGEPYEIEYRLRSGVDGEHRWFLARANAVRDECGRIVQWSGTSTDIDEQKRFEEQVRRYAAELKESRAELTRLARHDALTGLPNRMLFEDRLQQALVSADRHGQMVGVFFIDLDGFKRVNDTLGHHTGDALLCEVARRLATGLRATDTLARLGGDEFVVLALEIERPHDAIALARKLLAHVAEPFELEGGRVRMSASIGVSIYPRDADGASTLLRHADVAMYRAKQSGKNDARFYAPEMNASAQERMSIATRLDGALERGEMSLRFQPQWDTRSRSVDSFEALLRWNNPELGEVAPERFVPVAEDNGMILALCEWVLDGSCREAVRWSKASGRAVRVAMNVSLVQLDRDDFVPMVSRALDRHALPPQQLELELTARMGTYDVLAAHGKMAALRELGVRLTMDDFGTPYSTIDHVLRLPLDALKVDQRIVHDLEDAPREGSERVMRALVGLAHSLGLDVVADGIETDAQRRSVIELGCGRLQGYLLGEPMLAEEAGVLLGAEPAGE
ncbi:MAG: EAL domain-containing protein [Trueperaceae bacterium]|nr:EAL domain-containing protein [Trueperaceae bacterium]